MKFQKFYVLIVCAAWLVQSFYGSTLRTDYGVRHLQKQRRLVLYVGEDKAHFI